MVEFDLSKITGDEPPLEEKGPCVLCVEQYKLWEAEVTELAHKALGESLDEDQCPIKVISVCIDKFKEDEKFLKSKLREIYSHLGAALCQSIDSDDEIIMGHVRDSYEIAKGGF